MIYMLDANAMILLLDLHETVLKNARQCSEGDLCISAIAYAEVARGSGSGKPPPDDLLAQAIAQIHVVPFDDLAGRRYAELPFARHRFDRLIAAHALSPDLTLITANLRDFADIPGLKVEDWTI